MHCNSKETEMDPLLKSEGVFPLNLTETPLLDKVFIKVKLYFLWPSTTIASIPWRSKSPSC